MKGINSKKCRNKIRRLFPGDSVPLQPTACLSVNKISNNTFRVNEEATANSTCSSRRNILQRSSVTDSISARNV